MTESPRSVAIAAAKSAGLIVRDLFGRVSDVRFKGSIDLVTEADDLSEQEILRVIGRSFPEHGVLTEESGMAQTGAMADRFRWIVDPLDGTTNFAHGYPMFAVSIGFEADGELRTGVVYAPQLDELYVAERGGGAYRNGERLKVSETDTLIRAMVATGFHYDRELAARNVDHWRDFVLATQAARRDGSAALDLCSVACGRFDGYWEMGLRPWDTAAGILMVAEAGGKVTDFGGGPFALGESNCLATNGRIHELMGELLRAGAAARDERGEDVAG